jgi:hypothetical protein
LHQSLLCLQGCPDNEAKGDKLWLLLTPAVAVASYDSFASFKLELARVTVGKFGIELDFSALVSLES